MIEILRTALGENDSNCFLYQAMIARSKFSAPEYDLVLCGEARMKGKDLLLFDFTHAGHYSSFYERFKLVPLRRCDVPIFEFRCMECGNLFEKIFLSSDETVELECPDCQAQSCERVVSRTNHVIGLPRGGRKPEIKTKSCSSGNSCMSFTLPGYTRD